MDVLEAICKKENLTLPKQIAAKIAANSKGNLRRAILMLETSKVQKYPFSADQPLQIPDWERFVSSIVSDVLMEQSPRQLLVVRAKLYQLLINCIPASVIMKVPRTCAC
jgi:replication factor C subunit 3/5